MLNIGRLDCKKHMPFEMGMTIEFLRNYILLYAPLETYVVVERLKVLMT